MYNLAIKCMDVMKKSKDSLTGQLTTAEKQNLVARIAETGVTHIAIAVLMNTQAQFTGVGTTPSPRTVAAETQDWCDVIHAQDSVWGTKLRVLHRGSWGDIEGPANAFNIPFQDNTKSIGTPSSAPSDGVTTWNGMFYTYLWTHVGDHVMTGDVFAPAPEATIQIFASSNDWPTTGGAGIQANYATIFANWKTLMETYATAKGVTLTFMSHNQYSEIASGWIPNSVYSNQGITGVDYYGQYQGSGKRLVSDYIYDWNYLYTLKGYPIFIGEIGLINNDSIPNFSTMEERMHFEIQLYKAYRDSLVDLGKVTGANAWSGWEGQNTSMMIKSGSGASSVYTLNADGKIFAAFLKSQAGMKRIPVITAGTTTHNYTF